MIAICEHYKWKRLALITETNDVMRSISEVMRTDMAEGGIANVADLTVPMNVITDIKAADAIFKQLELSDARIIVMLAYVSLLHPLTRLSDCILLTRSALEPPHVFTDSLSGCTFPTRYARSRR